MGKLDNKVAMITGSGRGIGKAIALCFAGEGADIVVNDLNVPDMEATVAEIRALGRKAIAIKADVSRKDDVNRLVTEALKAFKKIDILVNNAGVTRHAPLLEMSEEDWDLVLNINLKGNFLCTQAVGKHMVQQKYGKIINLASVMALGAFDATMANYVASKAGIASLTKVAAMALGPYGINVNAIAPGTILTGLAKTRRTPAEYEVFLENRKKVAVLGRVGEVQDVANLALFLASKDSSFITGNIVSCDGGRIDKF